MTARFRVVGRLDTGRLPSFGDERLPRSFWAKVHPEPNTGCWLWAGDIAPNGYGHSINGQGAHRRLYVATVREIGKLQLDHLCRERSCVNPAHLEPVTGRVNTLRSPTAPAAINARKTHCRKGHALAGINLHAGYSARGQRVCRICRREYDKLWRRAWKAKKRTAATT